MSDPQPQPSSELLELILIALDHGMESVKASGTLFPFLMTTGTGRPKLQRFVADSLERCTELLNAAACSLPADVDLYASAVDGCLESDNGERRLAVVVAGGQRGQATAFAFAQRYLPKDANQEAVKLGDPEWIGNVENSLRDTSKA